MVDRAATPRVLLVSPVGPGVNPYISLLQGGLAAAGASVRLVPRLTADELEGECCPDVVHLHWLDRYDLPPAILFPGLHPARDLPRRVLRRLLETACNLPLVYQGRRWARLRHLLTLLRRFRAAGGRVVYTVHNLDPHEEGGPADRWALRHLIGLADALHVHDISTAEALARTFGRREGVAVIPHGHYLDCYPNTVSRQEARARLGLPQQAFVYALLGWLRPYKGVEELLRAFRALPDRDAILLIAGKAVSEAYASALASLAASDPRVHFYPGLVLAPEVQHYLNSADICVLPYRQVTTSGAALLAFSFGLPVIAPALGAFPHLIQGRRGLLYDPSDPQGLERALAQARQMAWQEARAEVLAWVAQFDWVTIGNQLLRVYQGSDG